jgi:hypothetical protein
LRYDDEIQDRTHPQPTRVRRPARRPKQEIAVWAWSSETGGYQEGSQCGRQRAPYRRTCRQNSQVSRPVPAITKAYLSTVHSTGGYEQLFEASVFAVFYSGYFPRCALEIYDSGRVRIEKIFKLIEDCQLGIHDISRTELDVDSKLPRFNMPLELGIFLGARRFGTRRHKSKNCLILDRDPYRYQQFMSDISGQDIAAHGGDATALIAKVRDWLNTAASTTRLPAGSAIAAHFAIFQTDAPAICTKLHLVPNELTFVDYSRVVRDWLASPQSIPA